MGSRSTSVLDQIQRFITRVSGELEVEQVILFGSQTYGRPHEWSDIDVMELQAAHPSEAIALLREARQGYVAVQRDERVRAVDHLLGMADRARQAAERMRATP